MKAKSKNLLIIAGGAAIVGAYFLTRKNTPLAGIDCGWMVPQSAKMGEALPPLPALPPLSAEEIAAMSPEMQAGLSSKKSIVPIATVAVVAALLFA